MRKYLLLAPLLMPLGGCTYHPLPVTVYGASGAQFTAPDLCAALTKCLNSTEAGCYYNTETIDTFTTAGNEQMETAACKEVKK